MFILKNSIKSIYRYRRKYTLIGIILLFIVLIASVLISILNHTTLTTDALKTKYAGTIKVSKGELADTAGFRKEDYELFYALDYVERVDFNRYIMSTFSMGHNRVDITDDHKRVMSPEEYEAAYEAYKNETPVATVEILVDGETYPLIELNPNAVYIMGYNYDMLTDDKKARFVMESGRMYENDDECVITQNPLLPDEEWNLLSIGDTIRISKYTGESKEYTVVGILNPLENITAETKTRVLFTTFDSAEAFGRATITKDESIGSIGPINNPIEPNLGVPSSDDNVNQRNPKITPQI